jgi:hypothetical protein
VTKRKLFNSLRSRKKITAILGQVRYGTWGQLLLTPAQFLIRAVGATQK